MAPSSSSAMRATWRWQPTRRAASLAVSSSALARAASSRGDPCPIYVGLVNWTDQGTKEFRGSVQRANGFRELVEQAGGRVREMIWIMGEYDFITVFEAPDDETAAALVLRVAAAGNVHTKTMRAFDADQMTDIIARTG
jgi:uncharacterized protein with GYD domain